MSTEWSVLKWLFFFYILIFLDRSDIMETGQENIPLNQIENDEIQEITNLLEIPEKDNSYEIYLKSSPPTQHVHYIPNIPCENSWTCTGMNTIHFFVVLNKWYVTVVLWILCLGIHAWISKNRLFVKICFFYDNSLQYVNLN